MIRFRLDGLPRDLPLSREERRLLRERVRAWRPADGSRPPMWVAMIPAGVMAFLMLIWLPVIWHFHSPWRFAMAGAAVLVQFPLTHLVMMRVMWKHTCRAMAGTGYEVCPRCAYPLSEVARDKPLCPECGAERVAGPLSDAGSG